MSGKVVKRIRRMLEQQGINPHYDTGKTVFRKMKRAYQRQPALRISLSDYEALRRKRADAVEMMISGKHL